MSEKKLFEPVSILRPGNEVFRRRRRPLLSRPTETWPCGTIQIVTRKIRDSGEPEPTEPFEFTALGEQKDFYAYLAQWSVISYGAGREA